MERAHLMNLLKPHRTCLREFTGLTLLLTLLLTGEAWSAGTEQAKATESSSVKPSLILVQGAAGEESYQAKFTAWGDKWLAAAKLGEARVTSIGRDSTNALLSLEQLRTALSHEAKEGPADLWIVLIGHGTFNGREAKFNLTGGDLSAAELAALLQPFHRRVALVQCASASAPFIQSLSGPNRTILTATKSGAEQNFARYGDFLSASIGDLESDLDKDGQVSLLEAHLTASKRTTESYETEGKLATEHSLIDDNGDKLGTPADWFRGIRAVKKAKDGSEPDGLRAHQLCLVPNDAERKLPVEIRQKRDALELEVAQLREKKTTLDESEYYLQLEAILLQLSRLYRDAPSAQRHPSP